MHLDQVFLVVEDGGGDVVLQLLVHVGARHQDVGRGDHRHRLGLALIGVGRDVLLDIVAAIFGGEIVGIFADRDDLHLAGAGEVDQRAGRQSAGPEARVDRAVTQRGNRLGRAELAAIDVGLGVEARRLEDADRADLGRRARRAHRDHLALHVGDAFDAGSGRGDRLHEVAVEIADSADVQGLVERFGAGGRGRHRVAHAKSERGRVGLEEEHVVDRRVRLLDGGVVAFDVLADLGRDAAAERIVDAARSAGGDGQVGGLGVGGAVGRDQQGRQRERCDRGAEPAATSIALCAGHVLVSSSLVFRFDCSYWPFTGFPTNAAHCSVMFISPLGGALLSFREALVSTFRGRFRRRPLSVRFWIA